MVHDAINETMKKNQYSDYLHGMKYFDAKQQNLTEKLLFRKRLNA
jgi:hypothetical protein